MKTEWKIVTLGDVCGFQNGFAFKSNLFRETGHPILRISNIQDEEVETRKVVYFRLEDYKENLERYRVVNGDLLIAMSGGTTGKIGFNTTDQLFYLNQRVGKFEPKDCLSKQFLFYFLSTRVEENLRISAGSAQPNLSTEQIKGFELPLPSLPEQQRIVAILDEAFDGIATAKANAEQNLQNARALFESHLQAVFSQRGEGWKQKTLEEIATTFGRGKSRHRPRNEPKLYGGKYPFIQTGDIRNSDHFITEYSQTYSEAGLAQSKLWPKGTICITIAANIAETGILDFDACFPDSVIGVVANPEEADVEYVEYLLQSFKVRIQAMGKGSAQANINMGTFENERFPFPKVSEQKQIVEKLNSLREETQRLESIYQQKLAALDALKKSLLDQAFTGEL